MENWEAAGFGLYVHWPFCEAICPYCDFNVRVARDVDDRAWRTAFEQDIRHWAERTSGRILSSIYFGGGTPSLMSPGLVEAVIDCAADSWRLADDVEMTLEANPTSTDRNKLSDFAAAGINRFSIGLQSLEDDALAALGRRHSGADGVAAVEAALATDRRVTFDLIYGRPGQELDAWQRELTQALSLGASHCSLYELTIEPGTPFGHRAARGRLPNLPTEDEAAAFYELTGALCAEADFSRYEVSSYARNGTQSRHNRVYWNAGDWVGVGPGAHGRLTLGQDRIETVAARDPATWLDGECDVRRRGGAVETLSHEDVAEERLFGGLRTAWGVERGRLRQAGYDVPEAQVTELVSMGLLQRSDTRLVATPRGLALTDAIVGSLVPLEPVR
jgi:oxygen-independent coproporphyrinogen-3 oxidase